MPPRGDTVRPLAAAHARTAAVSKPLKVDLPALAEALRRPEARIRCTMQVCTFVCPGSAVGRSTRSPNSGGDLRRWASVGVRGVSLHTPAARAGVFAQVRPGVGR